jgi:hypothetical protein
MHDEIFEAFKNDISVIVESSKTRDVLDILDRIKKECKPFLKHKQLLYRGMDKDSSSAGIAQVRKNRNSKGMSGIFREFFNTFLKENKLPLRHESLFCIAHETTQSYRTFGNKYAVFPKGNFDFVWFQRFRDINMVREVNDIERFFSRLGLKRKEVWKKMEENTSFKSKIEFLKEYMLTNDKDATRSIDSFYRDIKMFETRKLPDVMNSKEIAIDCDEYYYIFIGEGDEGIEKIATIKEQLGI